MDFPTEVTIETQAICNAACTFCTYPTMERKGNKMPDAYPLFGVFLIGRSDWGWASYY
jgi:hypothetical protein